MKCLDELFKMDGYEPLSEEAFILSLEIDERRNNTLRFLLEANKSGLFDKKAFEEAILYIDMGFMMMEKALFTPEAPNTE